MKKAKKERRYLIVTWSADTGTDEKFDFNKDSEAALWAKHYFNSCDYVAVLDRKMLIAYVLKGDENQKVFNETIKVRAIQNYFL